MQDHLCYRFYLVSYLIMVFIIQSSTMHEPYFVTSHSHDNSPDTKIYPVLPSEVILPLKTRRNVIRSRTRPVYRPLYHRDRLPYQQRSRTSTPSPVVPRRFCAHTNLFTLILLLSSSAPRFPLPTDSTLYPRSTTPLKPKMRLDLSLGDLSKLVLYDTWTNL